MKMLPHQNFQKRSLRNFNDISFAIAISPNRESEAAIKANIINMTEQTNKIIPEKKPIFLNKILCERT